MCATNTNQTEEDTLENYHPARTYDLAEHWDETRIEHAASRKELIARLRTQPAPRRHEKRWHRQGSIRRTDHGFEMSIVRDVYSTPPYADPVILSAVRKCRAQGDYEIE